MRIPEVTGKRRHVRQSLLKEIASGICRYLCAHLLIRPFHSYGSLNGESISISALLQVGWSLVSRNMETPNGFETTYHQLTASKAVLSFDLFELPTLNLSAVPPVESHRV